MVRVGVRVLSGWEDIGAMMCLLVVGGEMMVGCGLWRKT